MMRRGDSGLSGILLIALLLGAGYYYLIYQPGNSVVKVDLTVTYADGSTQIITLPGTNLLGGSVVDLSSGKALSSLGWSVKASPSWTGNAATFSCTGTVDLYVSSLRQTNPISFNTNTGLGTAGSATFTVKSGTLLATTLESWDPATGSKNLQFQVSVTGKLIDTGGVTTQLNAVKTVNFAYSVQANGITGLSVSMTTTPT